MKTIALYYSLDERTTKIVTEKAKELKAELLIEVKEVHPHSKFGELISEITEPIRHQKPEIEPLGVDLDDYGIILIFMPSWGGHPMPVMNSIIELTPQGKEIEIYITSYTGESDKSADHTSDEFQKRGSLVTKHVNLHID